MILATVEFPADRTFVVDLTIGGWVLRGDRGADVLAFEASLGRVARLGDYGPSDGDPVARAAGAAARFLGGAVAFVREPDPIPPDAVF